MKALFTLLLLLFGSTIAFGQISTADSLREAGNLTEAIEAYKAQLQNDPEDLGVIYNLSCAYALTHRADSAFKYLEIANREEVSVQPFGDPDFYYLIEDSRWDSLRNDMISKVEAEYGPYGNRELSIELWTMRLKDQAFYYHLDFAENKVVKSALWELKHIINDENLNRLEEIIEEYGWPQSSDVGGNAASAAFLIVQHADLETQKKYLPLMREAADKGEASWSSLALLIDRIEMREGRPQIYGSQIRGDGNGNWAVHEIADPEYVNQRRKEVGLGPIEEYVKNWNIEWTVEQKTKEE